MIQYEFERNKLPFWEKSKFPTEFELKIQEMNQFEIGLQFKGVQSLGLNFHKFTKILSWHNLQYYEFRLTHLYSKF
jgi:hypothetical protein